MVTKEEILEMKRQLAEYDRKKQEKIEAEKNAYWNYLVAELKKDKKIKEKQTEKRKKKPVNFTRASTSLPNSLYDQLIQKAESDGMTCNEALKILAHRYVAGVIELDKKDARLVDKYYQGQEF